MAALERRLALGLQDSLTEFVNEVLLEQPRVFGYVLSGRHGTVMAECSPCNRPDGPWQKTFASVNRIPPTPGPPSLVLLVSCPEFYFL